MRLQLAILVACLAITDNLASQKLVTIGDSQTASCGWQPWVVEQTGCEWSQEETLAGTDGHRAMAVGGTLAKPNNEMSICLRGRDAIYYQPDKVIIYAGQNDSRRFWINPSNPGNTAIEQVQYEQAYTGDTVNTDVTSVAALKGLIELLRSQLPQTTIYLMTHVPVLCVVGMDPSEEFTAYYRSPRFANMDEVIAFEQNERAPKDNFIRALGELYNLPVIDLWKYSGITYYNTELYYGEPAGDCTQVHLNYSGEEQIAICIADYLLHAPTHYDADWKPMSALIRGIAKSNCCYTISGHPIPETTDASRLGNGIFCIEHKLVLQR